MTESKKETYLAQTMLDRATFLQDLVATEVSEAALCCPHLRQDLYPIVFLQKVQSKTIIQK